jgi:hypothetical protein
LGQLAFAGAGVMLVEILSRDQLQNGITEVFKTLVVARRQVGALVCERTVCDCFQQQAGVAEMDSDLFLELPQRLG